MNNIAACVTLQNTCERLIKHAKGLCRENDRLYVLHIAKNGQSFMGGINDGTTLEYLYGVSHKANADMTVLHSDDIVSAVCDFVNDNMIDILVLGVPSKNERDNGIVESLKQKLMNKCEFVLIDKQEGV